MMFKKIFIVTWFLLCCFNIFSASLLPSPFQGVSVPRVGGSCKSCKGGNNSEQPGIDGSPGVTLAVKLSGFSPVSHDLLTIELGEKLPYCPTEIYQLLPPGAKGGDKKFLIAVLGSNYIGFKTKISKLGNLKFYSINYPGYSIHRESDYLVLTRHKKSLQYLFSSKDGGYSWKIAKIRNLKFHAKQIQCEYDDKGLMNAVVYPENRRFTINYKDGLPIKVSDPIGAITDIEWDERSHIKRLKTSLLPSHPFFPYRGNNPIALRNKKKPFVMRDIHAECNGKGKILSLVNTNGERFIAEYRVNNDKKNKTSYSCCLLTYPDKRTVYISVLRDKNDGITKIEKGNVSIDKGKEIFNPMRQTLMKKKANTLASFEKTYYDRVEKLHRDSSTLAITGTTDALGRTTHFTYNEAGLKTSTTFADGSSVKLKYDKKNRITQRTDAMGRITTYKYNDKNQIESVNELGNFTKYVYDQKGCPIKTIMPDKTEHVFSWDTLFRMTSHLKPDGTMTQYKYPKILNNITKINIKSAILTELVPGSGVADSKPEIYSRTFSYDPHGRLIKIKFPDKTSNKFHYDCCNLTGTVDRAGAVTKYAYDSSHRKVLEISPNKEKTIFKYDNMNNITEIIYPNTTIASFKYDKYKNRTESTTPEGAKENTQYDILGKKTEVTYSDKTKTKFKYNSRNRLIAISGTHQNNIKNKYNAAGQITSSANHGLPAQVNPRVTNYSYDKLGRLLKTSFSDSTAQVRYYIGFSHKLKAIVSKGVITSYKYDDAGRLISTAKYSTADLKKGKKNLFKNNITETRSYDNFGNLKEVKRAIASTGSPAKTPSSKEKIN